MIFWLAEKEGNDEKLLNIYDGGCPFLNLISCAPMVKTDLKSLQENPEAYKGKKVIVIADIKSVVETPEIFRGQKD